MEFKGTQGNWKLTKTKNNNYNVSGDGWTNFCKINAITNACGFYDDETKANALLISKAPEMLEMLQNVCTELYKLDNDLATEVK